MANTAQEFESILLTYKDVKDANPGWSDRMIEDYLALKRDLAFTADTTDQTFDAEIGTDSLAISLINSLRAQVGSGNPLTWDETGFTWDSTKLSFDQTEA